MQFIVKAQPYKFNEDRRQKSPGRNITCRAGRITTWLWSGGGSLTVWVTEEAIAGWHAPATGKRGGQPVYSDLAIETGLGERSKGIAS
jgi:hypothetical protein